LLSSLGNPTFAFLAHRINCRHRASKAAATRSIALLEHNHYVPPKVPFSDLQQPARQAAAQPWVEQLARCGYAAKGFVYLIVGLLAAQAAFTTGGKTTDTSGALETIVSQPFGKFLLA
jgi:hypothetical protein